MKKIHRYKNKLSFLIFFQTIVFFGFSQTTSLQHLKTHSLGGIFKFGKDIERGPIGMISIYPETDSTILFFIDINRGAPSYNMGNLYGRVKIKFSNGIFYKKNANGPCGISFSFKGDKLTLTTSDEQDHCGFGYGVYVDGVYKRKSKKIPEYFIDMTEKKYFFKSTDPDKWEVRVP